MLSYFLTDWQRTAKGVAMGVFCPEIIFLKMYHVLYNFIVNTPQNDSRWLWIHQTMHLHVRLPLRQLTALPNHCKHPQKKFLAIRPREEPNINVISNHRHCLVQTSCSDHYVYCPLNEDCQNSAPHKNANSSRVTHKFCSSFPEFCANFADFL